MVVYREKVVVHHKKMIVHRKKMIVYHKKMIVYRKKMVVYHKKIVMDQLRRKWELCIFWMKINLNEKGKAVYRFPLHSTQIIVIIVILLLQ